MCNKRILLLALVVAYLMETRIFYGQAIKVYPEEIPGGSMVEGAILNFRLGGKVLRGVDGSDHPFYSEEGGEVGGVGRDEDKSKEPPDAPYYAARDRSVDQQKCKIMYSKYT